MELERRLMDVSGQLNSGKKPAKTKRKSCRLQGRLLTTEISLDMNRRFGVDGVVCVLLSPAEKPAAETNTQPSRLSASSSSSDSSSSSSSSSSSDTSDSDSG